MVNYQNGKIYKLVSFQTDKIYIGSTCEKLTVRKAKHKSDYKRFLDGKRCSITSFEILKYDDVDIILLEKCPCENKEELHRKERFYIENTNNCVNKYIPTRTDKEYYEDNREKIKEYREQNKEKIQQQKKIKIICDCGSQINTSEKARHKRTKKHIEATKPQ